MVRALKFFLLMVAVELVVLVGSGVAVLVRYHPGSHRNGASVIHAAAGYGCVATAFLAAIVAMAAALPGRDGRTWLTPGAFIQSLAISVAAVVIAVMGRLMVWDQLARPRVVNRGRLRGYRAIFERDVQFALIAGREVAIGVLRTLFVLHVTLTVLAAAVLAGAIKWSLRAHAVRARPPGTSTDESPA